MVRSTDRPDMTLAIDRGRKTLKQTNKAKKAQNSSLEPLSHQGGVLTVIPRRPKNA